MEELIRSTRSGEMGEVVRIVNSVFRPDGRGIPMDVAFAHFLCEENADQIYVLESGGEIVSVLGTLRSRIAIEGCEVPVVSVGSVCTLPAHRGKGYSTRILEWLDPRLRSEGTALMLVSGTRGLYRRQNCLEAGESYELVASDGFAVESEGPGTFAEHDESRLPELLEIYDREAVRFTRSEHGFRSLLRNQSYLSYLQARPAVFAHEVHDSIDAYVIFGIRSRTGGDVGEVIELAGDDGTLVRLVGSLKKSLELPKVVVHVPSYRRSLADLLVANGCALRTMPIPGTVKVIDFGLLWEWLEPYCAARFEDEPDRVGLERVGGEMVRLSLGEETLFLDRRGATHLVFNGPQLVRPSPLKTALSRAFPLPFVYTYNLNYI